MHPHGLLKISIENLPHIAAAYSEGVAGRVLHEIWRRFETAPAADRWQVTTEHWGVSVWLREDDGDAWDELEATICAAALEPVEIGGTAIIVGLHCGAGRPEGWGELPLGLDVIQYRSDMRAVAAAYAAMTQGRTHFAEQTISGSSGPSDTLYRECLLRLTDAGGRLMMPAAWLAAMERLGLTRAFDRQVVHRVVAELKRRPFDVLGCNISALSVTKDLWWNSLLSELALVPGLAKRLVVEITETARLPSIDRAVTFVAAIGATGARVAMDDFGAGFSTISFARLSRLDIIKIDRSFLRPADPDDAYLLGHMIILANAFAGEVVVEGVETEADLQVALAAGARWFQGYFFGKPACVAGAVSK
ncbi:EAL domain-containing protein [Rhizobium puerariae]|uniref:EAL domain-containing protein n=1 Tax=Rhizobium puerariae TaxID=1585791 RepID=A0ABV6ACL0_9HYPH